VGFIKLYSNFQYAADACKAERRILWRMRRFQLYASERTGYRVPSPRLRQCQLIKVATVY
jgi:hypothetical protein